MQIAMLTSFAAVPVAQGFAVATLNTDTFKLEATAPERAAAQQRLLGGYDVLCINSVFDGPMQQKWIAEVQDEYPHSFVPPLAESRCGCPREQYDKTMDKFLANPGLASAPELFKEYGPDYFSCSTCFFNAYNGSADSLAVCDLGQNAKMLPQTGCYVADGSMGNFILSRLPFEDTQHEYFERATTLRRGGLAATVRESGVLHQVFCTHLQDGEYDRRAYPHNDTTWNGENEWNGRDYLAFAEAVGKPQAQQYLAGDFNVGPAHESRFVVRPRGMENHVYESVLASGWRNAYLEQEGADCTICFDNTRAASSFTIRNISTPHVSQQASHIFTKNVDLTGVDAHRVAVGPQQTESLGSVYLTDKYGIGMVLGAGAVSV